LHYPNETDRQEAWLRANPKVDFYVYKEGENGLLTLLDALEEVDLDVARVKTKLLHDVFERCDFLVKG
jgi:hypothetical protein